MMITTNADAGWLVRLFPNLMYYTFFLPAVAFMAEDE